MENLLVIEKFKGEITVSEKESTANFEISNKNDWWPREYTPGLSVDDWERLLRDEEVFTEGSLEIMKRMMDCGGQASCTKLSNKYGKNFNFYNAGSTSLARRVIQKTGCPVMSREEENSKLWPILYVGRYAKKEEEGFYIWKLREELAEALTRIDLSHIILYANTLPNFWKISHVNDHISEEEFETFYENRLIVVHKTTAAKGTSKKTQGEDFMTTMKKGDYFYLCRGNSIRLLGRIDVEEALENSQKKDNWFERKYTIVAESKDISPYKGKGKWWTPNHNSTCIRIPEDDWAQFEDLILKPYFNKTRRELLGKEESIKGSKKYEKAHFLKEVYMTEEKYDSLVSVLKKKKNVILQGAPGVGKTFTAKRLAYSIMGEIDEERVEFIQFHQNYSYEDFMMGYKPFEDGFKLKYGIFYQFCQKASAHPDKDYFFIIDEINRGNMSKIFGELLMLIEAEYRNTEITLAYNGLKFSVPNRLHIIGMMNTADRSLAMIDYALRRRFSFIDIEPGFSSEGFLNYKKRLNYAHFDKLIQCIIELNDAISGDPSLGKGFCIGHSYFCGIKECSAECLREIVEFDILPMLSEYWFDDESKLETWRNKLYGVLQ